MAYGHRVGKIVAFAYIDPNYAKAGQQLDVMINAKMRKAVVSIEPAYDADNHLPRGK
ncbi:MAG: glycine cleavage T C-terminal barrel domain-containing protein [Pseudomonadota bacterium]